MTEPGRPASDQAVSPPWRELAASAPDWVVGHLHPDLDSLVSARVAASVVGSRAAAWGEPEPISAATWERLGEAPLALLPETGSLGLVDTSRPETDRPVCWAVDHHPLGRTACPYPVYMLPLGATATILAQSRDQLDCGQRRLLASAILADTMALCSNRTTAQDRAALDGLFPDWRSLLPLVFPRDLQLSPEQWRKAGRKQILGLPWASGGGFSPAPDLDAIAAGEAGPFAFSWIDLEHCTTTLALVLDHQVVRRLTYPQVLSRTRIGPEILQPMEQTFGGPLRYESESRE